MGRLTVLLISLALSGCATAAPVATTPTLTQPPTTSVPTAASIAPNPMASPSLAGEFAVDPSGRKVALRCDGTGSPTVFLESGGGAIDELTRESLTRRLATQTQVCLYNRAGLPPSDPAPNEPREAEDVASDFHALVTTPGIAPAITALPEPGAGPLEARQTIVIISGCLVASIEPGG